MMIIVTIIMTMIMGMMMLTILNTKKPKTNINNGKKKWQM
jgi:hypothetical protein